MFIIAGREVIPLAIDKKGFYRDASGCIFALRDDSDTVDIVDRCGVGPFSLPVSHPLNDACRPHDYAFSSPGYQAFHSRREADQYLADLVRQVDGGRYAIWAPVFQFLSRIFGSRLWERKDTR